MADVLLFQTNDGGEIECVNGEVTLTDGIETAFFLSLFGGNEDDSGQSQDDRRQWWANLQESNSAATYRSETQNLLKTLPVTPTNIVVLEGSVERDLAWMTNADSLDAAVAVSVSIPKLNTWKINVTIEAHDRRFERALVIPGAAPGANIA